MRLFVYELTKGHCLPCSRQEKALLKFKLLEKLLLKMRVLFIFYFKKGAVCSLCFELFNVTQSL